MTGQGPRFLREETPTVGGVGGFETHTVLLQENARICVILVVCDPVRLSSSPNREDFSYVDNSPFALWRAVG